MDSSLIRGKYVVIKVTGADSAQILTDGAIYQENGEIIDVGSYDALKAKHPSTQVIGSSEHVVIPGLINDHDHVGFSSVQLGVPHAPLELSGLGRIGARQLDPYLEHLNGAIEMLKTGTTTVQIMYTPGRGAAPIDSESTGKVIKAYQDAGGEAVLRPKSARPKFYGCQPPGWGKGVYCLAATRPRTPIFRLYV